MPSARLNIAVFAPMPSAIEITAIRVNPGFFASILDPCRTSCQSVSTIGAPRGYGMIKRLAANAPKNPRHSATMRAGTVRSWDGGVRQRPSGGLRLECGEPVTGLHFHER